jgi:acyl-CoA reductase-like NAD-dependent aldehyde dehydrogenase
VAAPHPTDLPAAALDESFARARAAQGLWANYTLSQRVRLLRRLWSVLERGREELAGVVHEETGKLRSEFELMELGPSRLALKYFTRNAHRLLQDRPAPRPWTLLNKRAYVRWSPRGVVGVVSPWNMPFLLPFSDVMPALLAGNAVILKPSERAPRTALWFARRSAAAGLLPEGLFQVLPGGPETGAGVVERSDLVVFTGGAEAGRSVARAAGARMIPAVLELGGKHPMLVLRDAPLERAAKAAVWGAFANCGQVCVGVERVFVERAAHDAFCALLERETGALRPGLADGWDVDLGRLAGPDRLAVFERHLDDARAKGARVVGGEILDRERLLVSPALVFGAQPGMLVMEEESFAPILPVMAVERVEDALRLANEHPSGLAASVWTRDGRRGERLAALLECGVVGVNDLLTHNAVHSLPFGGWKASGLGVRHSEEGLRMFCRPQSVLVHEWPLGSPEPWWFPYGRLKTRLLELLSRLS